MRRFILLSFLCLSNALGQGVETATIVRDGEGNEYSVQALGPVDQGISLPAGLGFDYRVVLEDTEMSLSVFAGIALDPDFTRTQTFLIRDGEKIIGLTTLIATPPKHLATKKYLKLENGELTQKSFPELFDIVNPQTFVVETGWFLLHPEYRNRKLASIVVNKVLLPAVEALILHSTDDVFIVCGARGNGADSLPGEVHPESGFTPYIAARMGFVRKPDVFGLSHGPTFVRQITESEREANRLKAEAYRQALTDPMANEAQAIERANAVFGDPAHDNNAPFVQRDELQPQVRDVDLNLPDARFPGGTHSQGL